MIKDDVVTKIVKNMVHDAVEFRASLSEDRTKSQDYYDGKMTDVPSDAGRSKVVSRDVRSAVKKILPSVMRVIMGNDAVVEYRPLGKGEEESSKQATDYINYVVIPESNAREAIEDALHDAIKLRNGIIKWWFDEATKMEFSKHTGLIEESFAELVGDDDVEVISHSEYEDEIDAEDENGEIVKRSVKLHDVNIKRRVTTRMVKIAAVPPEQFLIDPDATSVADSKVTGQQRTVTRSELVSMGYNKDDIDDIKASSSSVDDDMENEVDSRRNNYVGEHDSDSTDPSLAELDYYELYVTVDQDEDGIAELRYMCFAGSISEDNLLINEPCDKAQFCTISGERRPHQWEGTSIADDAMEIQKIKTVLLRQSLDNIYAQNNMQPVVKPANIINMDAVHAPEFGKPVEIKEGATLKDSLMYNIVPFVARDTFSMLDRLDAELTDRTGVTDVTAGLDPDALQNVTAAATNLLERAGVGHVEMMTRNVANGLKELFSGVLDLVIKNQDVPRTVQLQNEWHTFDPKHWNAKMNVSVNTGLGAGTRERDMAVTQMVLQIQKDIIAQMGANNPFVKPKNLYNTIIKMVEAAGLKSADPYFTAPDENEIAQKLDEAENEVPIEIQKVEAQLKSQMEIEKIKVESSLQIAQMKLKSDVELKNVEMKVARDKEMAQMEADLAVNKAKIEASTIARGEELQSNLITNNQKNEVQLKKIEADVLISREELAFRARMEILKLEIEELEEKKVELEQLSAEAETGMQDVQEGSIQ